MIPFYILGDMGSGTQSQYHVSDAIYDHIQKHNNEESFVCGLGDNIYKNGCVDCYDKQFQSKFEKPYEKIPNSVLFFMTLGNHDYGYKHFDKRGNSQSQIDYSVLSEKNGGKWRLPSHYYSFVKQDKEFSIEFFVIDTNLDMCDEDESNQQLVKMSQMIQSSKSHWKVVMGHHTWRSVGGHGNADDCLEDFLQTLYRKSPFDVYMCGHDHNKQVIEMDIDNKKPLLIVCGTGGKKYHDGLDNYDNIFKDTDDSDIHFCSRNLGYGYCEARPKSLQFTFFDETNTPEFSYLLKK